MAIDYIQVRCNYYCRWVAIIELVFNRPHHIFICALPKCPWNVLEFQYCHSIFLYLYSLVCLTHEHIPHKQNSLQHTQLQYLCIHFVLAFHSKVCSIQIANTSFVSFERIGFTSFYISKINIIFCGLENC